MLSSWQMMQRILMLALAVLAVAACAIAPEQTRVLAPTPLASPSAAASTPVPTAMPAAPTAPEAAPTSTAQLDNSALTRQLYQQVKDGTPVVKIADPKLQLPDHIHPGQIKQYFQIGTISIGLVLRPSLNVLLDVPATFTPAVAGLVISAAGAPWHQYMNIRDTDRTTKNNPYYLWAQAGQLYLSLVDQNGAGSSEGNMRLMRLAATGGWEVAGCYYFAGTSYSITSEAAYFASSQDLNRQKKQSASLCQTGDVVLLP